MKPEEFFTDFVNSGIFGKVVTAAIIPSKIVSKVEIEKLKTNFIDLSFLDKLEKRRKFLIL